MANGGIGWSGISVGEPQSGSFPAEGWLFIIGTLARSERNGGFFRADYAIDRMIDDIKASHGWDIGHDLYRDYVIMFAAVFERVFCIDTEKTPERSFLTVIGHYTDDFRSIKEDYDRFWSAKIFNYLGDYTEQEEQEWREKTYNPARVYVYRMSKSFEVSDKVSDREKMISNVLECRHVGDEFYDKAFFDLPLRKVIRELKEMVNK